MNNPAVKFDQLVHEVFAPCYPVIASQILDKAGISQGLCLDLGCGSGFLGLAIAEASGMELCLLDNDPEMLALCRLNAESRGLSSPIRLQQGDVHDIPLPDASVHLAVSRGSMFFWENQVQAFAEIRRVLAPGGMAYIGGGFGTPELKRQIDLEMERRSEDWKQHLAERIGPGCGDKYRQILPRAGIDKYEIDHGPVGLWIIFAGTASPGANDTDRGPKLGYHTCSGSAAGQDRERR